MADFFFQLVTDAVNYDDTEEQAKLYALKLSDIKDWVDNILQEHISNEFLRHAVLCDLCGGDSDFQKEIYDYIQDKCAPDEEEDNTCDNCGENCGDSGRTTEDPDNERLLCWGCFENYDCLESNPRCACGLLLSEDDMGVWEADKTKEPMCESCLAEAEKEDDE